MVKVCSVFGCKSRGGRSNVAFYKFPTPNRRYSEERQLNAASRLEKWLLAIKRTDLSTEKLNNARVCSNHFLSGKPSKIDDVNNPDWIPRLNLGYVTTYSEIKGSAAMERYERAKEREQMLDELKFRSQLNMGCVEGIKQEPSEESEHVLFVKNIEPSIEISVPHVEHFMASKVIPVPCVQNIKPSKENTPDNSLDDTLFRSILGIDNTTYGQACQRKMHTEATYLRDSGCQTDITSEMLSEFDAKLSQKVLKNAGHI